MHQGVRWKTFRQTRAFPALAFACANQMRTAAHSGCGLGIAQIVPDSVHLIQLSTKAVADLFEQTGQWFSAIALVLGYVRAIKNSVDAAACRRQHLVHLVVHLVQSGYIKQTTTQA